MEILDLRHFSSVDLRPLLDDEAQVWSRLLSWDYSGSAEMILRYVDAKILPGYAAVDRGRVFGYSFFVYEGSKGVIGDLYVTNGTRLPNAREVELKLLTHVIETLQQSPGIHRVEAQLLAHEANAVSRPFLDTGFQRHPRLFMAAARWGTPATAGIPAHPEVEIRPWTEADYQPSAAVITAAYRGHVDAQINDQYHTLSGSLRFLNNIVRFPGCGVFDAESSFVARRSQGEEPDRVDPVFAGPQRRGPRHPGLRAAGIPLAADRRVADGGDGRKSAEKKFLSALADCDGSECARGRALPAAGFRDEEDLRCVRVGRVRRSS